MYCENCGSRIPDGAKFCTECGAKVAGSSGAVPDVILPDIPDVILPDVPDIPDVILPSAPVIPDISQSLSHGEEEPADTEELPAEPAPTVSWSTVLQTPVVPPRPAPVPAAPVSDSAAASSVGYSTVSGYTYVPPETPEDARRPAHKRWWFWLILVLGVSALVFLVFAALVVYSVRNVMPSIDGLPAEIESILSRTEELEDIDDIPDFLENAFDLPNDPDGAFPLDADDKYVPMDTLTAEMDRVLTEMGLGHEIYVDEDDWVFIDVWTDGLDELAESAYEGDKAARAEWDALTENVRAMSEDFLSDLQEGGQHSAVCVVQLLDDVDPDLSLAIAIDGELILDLVSGLDEYDLMEE